MWEILYQKEANLASLHKHALTVMWYFPGMVKCEVFVVLLKHPFTALYIRAPTLPSRVRPPTHKVLKYSQETVIKPFPQVTQNQTC